MAFGNRLDCSPRVSVLYLVTVFFVHALAFVGVTFTSLGWLMTASLCLAVACSLFQTMSAVCLSLPNSIVRVSHKNSRWELAFGNGEVKSVVPYGETVILDFLIVARFLGTDEKNRTSLAGYLLRSSGIHTVCLLKDSLPPNEFRRLKVVLGFANESR